VEQSRRKRGGIQLHVREDVGYFEKMCDVGIAGAAELVAVAFCGNIIGAANQPGIVRGPIAAQLFQKLFQAGIDLPLGAVPIEVQRQIGRLRHVLVYDEKGVT
jgi:hypothetical protein